MAGRQRGDRAPPGQGTVGGVEAVRRDAPALLVGDVHHRQPRMEAEVARPAAVLADQPRRGVGPQRAGPCVEPELMDGVGADRLGDGAGEGVAVGAIGLQNVGADAGGGPAERRAGGDAVIADAVHGHRAVRVVGGEQEAAGAVGRHVARPRRSFEVAGVAEAPVARDPQGADALVAPPADVQHAPVRGERHRSGSTGHRVRTGGTERPAVGVERQPRDAVFAAERDVRGEGTGDCGRRVAAPAGDRP